MADLSEKEKKGEKKNQDISILLMFHFLAHIKAHLQIGEQLKFLPGAAKSTAIGMLCSIL